MKVIGTAGHIDHGKSALVRAITGIDPDRLEEEKRRGMTIDLGFAWLTLPSGEEVSIVDVPGHERFVKNMLAGVGGIDVALVVVAADESVMPQTREHVDILDLLGVGCAVVAITKCDLAEEGFIDLVADDVRNLLRGTRLEDSPLVPVSAFTGEGIDRLLVALDGALARTPPRRDIGSPLVPIDRVFSISGFGTVVTGTLQDGRLSLGAEVEVVPGSPRARIRGLQTHRRQVSESEPGDRVAVNLGGVSADHITRGDVLASAGSVVPVRRFDAHLAVVAGAPFPLADGMEVALHVGSAEQRAHLSLADREELAPGDSAWASIRLSDPTPVVTGQHFILRLPSPGRTVAGGHVVYVGRPLRPQAERHEILEGLSSDSLETRVSAWLRAAHVSTAAATAKQLRVGRDEVQRALDHAVSSAAAVRLGEEYMSTREWEATRALVRTVVEAHHAQWPLRRGMPKEELRARVRCPAGRWRALLAALANAGILVDSGAVVSSPSHQGGVGDRRHEGDRVVATLRSCGLRPLNVGELHAETGCDVALLAALAEAGEVVRTEDDLYVARDVFDRFSAELLQWMDQHGPVTVAEVRDHFGISRKHALALLEHLDSLRVTRRSGDLRSRGSRAPACA